MEEESKVSVWIGKLSSKEEFMKYISVSYDDDGNMISNFMKDFKIEYYDIPFQEAFFDLSGVKNEIFKSCSYIESFIDKIPSQDFHNYNCFVLIYNFNYNGDVDRMNSFKYVGTFTYI